MWWVQLLFHDHMKSDYSSRYVYIADIALWANKSVATNIQFGNEPDESETYLIINSLVFNSIILGTMSLGEAIALELIEVGQS